MHTNLTGNWTGTIVYGKGYSTFKGEKLYFDLELTHYGFEVAGIAIDTDGVGVSPDNANILGTFKDNRISFVKQYESMHYMTKEGTKVDKSRRGFKIKYTGIYNEATGSFSGEWLIKMTVLLFWLFPIPVRNSGQWTMKRK
jgi:hypothetical protein